MAQGVSASDNIMYGGLAMNLFDLESVAEMAGQGSRGRRPQGRRGGAHGSSPLSKKDGFDLIMKLTSCQPEILSELLLTRLDMKSLESLGAGAPQPQGFNVEFPIRNLTQRPFEVNEDVHLYRIKCCGGKQEDVLKIALEAELEYDAADVKPKSTVIG